MLLAFASVAVLAALDLTSDLREGTTIQHVLAESLVVVVGMCGAVAIAGRLLRVVRVAREAQQQAAVLTEQLAASRVEAARWREEAGDLLRGLGAAIEVQFNRWALTPAEREVALLLLKGLSHKELAEVRSISEATARQQARAVYRKAGLSGRNDLAAFFLEDLLLPGAPRDR